MKRDRVISGRKTRRLLLVAIVIVALVAVAVPLCADYACARSAFATPLLPSHTSLPHVLQAMEKAACDVVAFASNRPDSALPPVPLGTLPLVAAMLALVAVAALLWQWVPRRGATIFSRVLFPPGDLRGVRLLI
jgi:hypothetical protein